MERAKVPSRVHRILKEVKGYSYGAALKQIKTVYCYRVRTAGLCGDCKPCEERLEEKAKEVVRYFDHRKGPFAGYFRVCMYDLAAEVIEQRPKAETVVLDVSKVKVIG